MTMWRKPFAIVLCLSLFCSLPLSADISSDKAPDGQTIEDLLQSMKLDLQVLDLSIKSYKTQIAELQNIIDESQSDLVEQKLLLTESMDKLKTMQTQYDDLLKAYRDLNKRYTSSIAHGKIKNYVILGLSTGLITSIISLMAD